MAPLGTCLAQARVFICFLVAQRFRCSPLPDEPKQHIAGPSDARAAKGYARSSFERTRSTICFGADGASTRAKLSGRHRGPTREVHGGT